MVSNRYQTNENKYDCKHIYLFELNSCLFLVEPLINIYFITGTEQQITSKISQNINFVAFLSIVPRQFGEHATRNSRFIGMDQKLNLTVRNEFELKNKLIRNGSIIFEYVQTNGNVHNNQYHLMQVESSIFQNFYFLLSILFFLIFCIKVYSF